MGGSLAEAVRGHVPDNVKSAQLVVAEAGGRSGILRDERGDGAKNAPKKKAKNLYRHLLARKKQQRKTDPAKGRVAIGQTKLHPCIPTCKLFLRFGGPSWQAWLSLLP